VFEDDENEDSIRVYYELPNYPKFTLKDYGKQNLYLDMKPSLDYLGA
jgi:hypothetical protein|tara:strand:+ start:876 stop:1016 length:141 start_codon:yes stop_codon:yes gene_type:complete